MAFIRTKRHGSRHYYQVVESRRDSGKVRQKVLHHLGRHQTIAAALHELHEHLEFYRERVDHYKLHVAENVRAAETLGRQAAQMVDPAKYHQFHHESLEYETVAHEIQTWLDDDEHVARVIEIRVKQLENLKRRYPELT